jgi:competence protein ComFA
MNEAVYETFCRKMTGRALLAEEVARMLHDLGEANAELDWPRYAERAVQEGRVARMGGIVRTVLPRRRFGGFAVDLQCLRCGGGREVMRWTRCASCGMRCPYCERCLGMGRVRACTPLFIGGSGGVPPAGAIGGYGSGGMRAAGGSMIREQAERRSLPDEPAPAAGKPDLSRWGLSPAQRAAVEAALAYLEAAERGWERPNHGHGQAGLRSMQLRLVRRWKQLMRPKLPKRLKLPMRSNLLHRSNRSTLQKKLNRAKAEEPPKFLIWAVTGAGKTEMIFPLIARTIAAGRRALVATPRQDVVKELVPRLRKAFPEAEVAALYGGSGTPWADGAITVATTHQLLRFRHAFDLVVIDELDAFPYHNDPMLHYAAAKAGKPGAPTVLLSATPPAAMQRDIRLGRLAHVKVPARYHGHALPVPRRIRWSGRGGVARRLKRLAAASLARGAQVFVFVPRIDMVAPLAAGLRRAFPDVPVAGTSSEDPARSETVSRFRSRDIRILVTTTILERGVTVPKSDVFILDADAALFDEAALVQMAGRAGRSADDPRGRVYFFSRAWTRSQRAAIRHIRRMNREARRRGYLHAEGKGSAR